MLSTIQGSTFHPPLAKGAYATTSSIGVTSAEPSASEGTGLSGLVIPIFFAIAVKFSTPRIA